MGHPRPFFRLFSSFQTEFLQQLYVKNIHLVYGVGIRSHNLQIASHPITNRPGLPPKISDDCFGQNKVAI